MERYGVRSVAPREVEAWLRDPLRTTVLLDVRTPEEFSAGSIPGAAHAPGGQLVQATDQWVAVRNARIVLADTEGVRAPVVATWLRQIGCEVFVLEGGIHGCNLEAPAPREPVLPELASIAPSELERVLEAGGGTALDLNSSMSFRKAHVPGSAWTIRPRIASAARGKTGPIALIADDPAVARMAAVDLREAGIEDLRLLAGGLPGWTRAGYPTAASPGTPPDAACLDYLFFVHDRHTGNREAMKQYLSWETGLLAQMDGEDKAAFNVGP